MKRSAGLSRGWWLGMGAVVLLAPAIAAAPQPQPTPDETAGIIFGVPVSQNNYLFAKRIMYLFPRPWGAADLPVEEREPLVWDNLILHYEAFTRGIQATEEELDRMINELLANQQQPYTRRGDPEAYRKWLTDTAQEDAELFENQVRFVMQIKKLKDQVLQEQQVTVTEDELRQEFLNEQHHLGGEIVVVDTRDAAEEFRRRLTNAQQWEEMKRAGRHQVRPVNLMTLEAYMDLWSISKDDLYAFHAQPLGTVSQPLPFGKQWCIYHLLDKRTGDVNNFPAQRNAYLQQVEMKKKYQALQRWVEQLKQSARLEVKVSADGTRPPRHN